MMPPQTYAGLCGELSSRGLSPLTPPEAFVECHHLPGWYGKALDLTARSVWLEGQPPFTDDQITDLGRGLPPGPCVVKDFVKSEKQAWETACFVSDAHDPDALLPVVRAFCELRDERFEGGLVLRQFLDLRTTGTSDGGRPEADEWRVFVVRGEAVIVSPGFESVDDPIVPDLGPFDGLMNAIGSPLFTMDIATRSSGEPVLIEVGEGQVSGLPDAADAFEFYRALASALG